MLRLAVFSIALVLAACSSGGDKSKKDKPTVVEPLVGKMLVSDVSTFIFNADGTVGGTFANEGAIEGVYTANAKEVCSSYTAPEQLVAIGEICSVPVIENDTVVFNRRDGSTSPVYFIK